LDYFEAFVRCGLCGATLRDGGFRVCSRGLYSSVFFSTPLFLGCSDFICLSLSLAVAAPDPRHAAEPGTQHHTGQPAIQNFRRGVVLAQSTLDLALLRGNRAVSLFGKLGRPTL
jgi:hypothetical protein